MTTPDLAQARWRKASRSGGNGGQCVEVAVNLPGVRAVRDSKNPTGPALVFSPAAFAGFVREAKSGRLNPS